ncbi:putative chromatin regulator PHD family [Lupinus albus]|uniref:Putative chromatin regulator PHD family n=1 Tax=Lupinus albus TaxID=3870 RepID=A0A6A4QQ01_LUPAL|nr:putative chromatin regulator PHD family [Lupinus albus]
MSKRVKKKTTIHKHHQEPEDWCFECKDGGKVVVCDQGSCGKVYHPHCIDQDESLSEVKTWVCGWHYCITCRDFAKYYCLGCPNGSLCYNCIDSSKFTVIKRKKGLCSVCSELVLIIEQNLEQDSEGNKLTLNDRETYECLFKEYWEIVKDKEKLTSNDVLAALDNSKEDKSFLFQSDSSEDEEEKDEEFVSSDSDEDRTPKRRTIRRKRPNRHESKPSSSRRKSLLKKGLLFKKPNYFASINAKNINLVYLKQSLVQELSKQPESFTNKVVGAFVRVKVDAKDSKQRNSYHLVKVVGVLNDEKSNGFLFQVSSTANAIPISKISDADFIEEECVDLQQKVKSGLIPRLTVAELQEKAILLHEDITKHVCIIYSYAS